MQMVQICIRDSTGWLDFRFIRNLDNGGYNTTIFEILL